MGISDSFLNASVNRLSPMARSVYDSIQSNSFSDLSRLQEVEERANQIKIQESIESASVKANVFFWNKIFEGLRAGIRLTSIGQG